jgi:hypothetical protein
LTFASRGFQPSGDDEDDSFWWSGSSYGNLYIYCFRKANIFHSIGRITEGLLLSISDTVDIVEPVAKFSDKLKGKPGVGSIYNVGLEEWTPSFEGGYDLIWNQWCVGHLTDTQLVEYLQRCKGGLKEGACVVVKENLSTSGLDLFDEVDSSVTRYVLRSW